MATTLTMAVNCDTQDLIYGSSAVDWQDVDIDNDKLVFSDGSDEVQDNASVPTEQEYNQAGTLISESADVTVAKCFLEDISVGILREIHNYADDKRYVFAFDFDGATASEPVLELWDDETLSSRDLYSLGNGVANDSWWLGAVTTNALPSVEGWSNLAGNTSGNFLWLNDEAGALTVAKTLYCNLKITIPLGTTQSGLEQPVIVVKYTAN